MRGDAGRAGAPLRCRRCCDAPHPRSTLPPTAFCCTSGAVHALGHELGRLYHRCWPGPASPLHCSTCHTCHVPSQFRVNCAPVPAVGGPVSGLLATLPLLKPIEAAQLVTAGTPPGWAALSAGIKPSPVADWAAPVPFRLWTRVTWVPNARLLLLGDLVLLGVALVPQELGVHLRGRGRVA